MTAQPMTTREAYKRALFALVHEVAPWPMPPNMRCFDTDCVFTFPHTDEVCAPHRESARPRFAEGGKVANPRFRDGANVMPR